MAAHAGISAPRSWGLIARLKAFTGRLELDRKLAVGMNEHARDQGAAVPVQREAALQAAFHAEAG